jgi:hypothetical protein
MMMRYCGGGMGHIGTRKATNQFYNDRHWSEQKLAAPQSTAADSLEENADEMEKEIVTGPRLSGSQQDEDEDRDRDSDDESHNTDSLDWEDINDKDDISDDELGPEDGQGGLGDEEMLGFAMY